MGSGRMWVSPAAEMDPRAVRVQLEGCNLPTESLIKRYLPKVLTSPITSAAPIALLTRHAVCFNRP